MSKQITENGANSGAHREVLRLSVNFELQFASSRAYWRIHYLDIKREGQSCEVESGNQARWIAGLGSRDDEQGDVPRALLTNLQMQRIIEGGVMPAKNNGCQGQLPAIAGNDEITDTSFLDTEGQGPATAAHLRNKIACVIADKWVNPIVQGCTHQMLHMTVARGNGLCIAISRQ